MSLGKNSRKIQIEIQYLQEKRVYLIFYIKISCFLVKSDKLQFINNNLVLQLGNENFLCKNLGTKIRSRKLGYNKNLVHLLYHIIHKLKLIQRNIQRVRIQVNAGRVGNQGSCRKNAHICFWQALKNYEESSTLMVWGGGRICPGFFLSNMKIYLSAGITF